MPFVAGPAAWAQAPTRTPSPQELWEAYPLAPEDAPPLQPDPDAELQSSPTPAPTRAVTASDDDGGLPLIVPIMLVAPLLFIAGLALGQRRRSRTAAPRRSRADPASAASPAPRSSRAAPAAAAATAEPGRFDWRSYPPPSRPAPPPPGSPPPATAAAAPRATAAAAPPAAASPPATAAPPAAASPQATAAPPTVGASPASTAVAGRSPWTRQAWRAELVWDGGFKVLVLAPGRVWPAGGGGPDEDAALVDRLQDLQAALEAEGWTPAGRAEPWYGRRFVWQHPDPPPGQGGPR